MNPAQARIKNATTTRSELFIDCGSPSDKEADGTSKVKVRSASPALRGDKNLICSLQSATEANRPGSGHLIASVLNLHVVRRFLGLLLLAVFAASLNFAQVAPVTHSKGKSKPPSQVVSNTTTPTKTGA